MQDTDIFKELKEKCMRLLDSDSDKSLDRVVIYLTKLEAKELIDSLESLLDSPLGNHNHISSNDYKKEVTVCIYDEKFLEDFSERSKKLILEDI